MTQRHISAVQVVQSGVVKVCDGVHGGVVGTSHTKHLTQLDIK